MIAGWSFLDSIYMVVITVFGVGYGETKPLNNPHLKVFTMGVIIAGCSSGIYVVGGFVQMLAEGEINRVLGTRRMSKGIEKLSGHALHLRLRPGGADARPRPGWWPSNRSS